MKKIHPDKSASFWFDIILIMIFALVSIKSVTKIYEEALSEDPYNTLTMAIIVGCAVAVIVSVRAILRLSYGIKEYTRRY